MIILHTVISQLRAISLSWWIMIGVVAVLMLIFCHRKEQLAGDLLVVYMLIIITSTVFSREPIGAGSLSDRINYDLIGTWIKRMTTDEYSRSELLLNFCMLLPVGALFPWAAKKSFSQTVLFGFAFTLLIELLQLFTGRGWFEVSDIFDNTVGVMIGYALYHVGSTLWRKRKC